MEGNKDDAFKCIAIAIQAKEDGNVEKAHKYLLKAERLYPTNKAKELLEDLNKDNADECGEDNKSAADNSNENSNQHNNASNQHDKGTNRPRSRHNSHRKKEKSQSESQHIESSYTQEQIDSVKRIKKCKDYYEILGVDKEATENDLKKAYRKLALQMHPDKNTAPGATEAFKAISNAFAVLNDPEKRKRYDTYGPELEQRQSHHYDYTHGGFEGDITPEELFNMFFGGGFPSSGVYTQRRRGHTHTFHHTHTNNNNNEGTGTLLLQLSPILILVILSLLSSFFVSDPLFSLNRSGKYPVERHTQQLRVPYYVKDDFHQEFQGSIRRIERQVEEEYVNNLRSNCFRERSYKENMMWRARNYGDGKLYNQALNMKTPSCDRLQGLYS